MTCREYVTLLGSTSPLSISEALALYEIRLEWHVQTCIMTDSDTFERILITDPEHLNVKY